MELVISESTKWATNIKTWFVKAAKAFIKARQAEANRQIAMMQLNRMTDKELHDIGIGRGDIRRIVYEQKD